MIWMNLMILMILILYCRSIEREVLRYIYIQTVWLYLGHQSTYGWAGFSHAWNMNLQQEANQYVEWFLEFRWKDETIGENHVNFQLGKTQSCFLWVDHPIWGNPYSFISPLPLGLQAIWSSPRDVWSLLQIWWKLKVELESHGISLPATCLVPKV